MDIEQRYALITRNTEELLTESELRDLLQKNPEPTAYIGFEPSGLVHMGWALVAQKITDLVNAGIKVTIFWADWHAYINDKLGGDLDNIRTCARYMEDCFIALGVPKEGVQFKYASEVLSNIEYWEKVIKVAKVTTLAKVKKSMTIMGRGVDEADQDASKVLYPILQATDIFCMDVDIAYAGIDQRRIHVLAKELADKLGWKKPVALHTPLLPGLKKPENFEEYATESDRDSYSFKMSKSDPMNSINIHDAPDDVRKKLNKAFCPPEKEYEGINPVLMICKYIVFPKLGKVDIDRPEKFGGPLSFSTYEELADCYFSGKLHPMDLKKGTAEMMIEVLAPVGAYFKDHPENYEALVPVLKKLGKL